MHYVISYDIADDRLRGKTAKLLERLGAKRLQKSVFTIARVEKRRATAFERALHRLLDGKLAPGDSLVMVPIEADAVPAAAVLGDDRWAKNFLPPPLFYLG